MEAAIIGLVGVIVGAVILTARDYLLAARREAAEERKWRRDHCLEAYSEFAGLVNMIITAAGECFLRRMRDGKTREKSSDCFR
jgi:hypothetical protein